MRVVLLACTPKATTHRAQTIPSSSGVPHTSRPAWYRLSLPPPDMFLCVEICPAVIVRTLGTVGDCWW